MADTSLNENRIGLLVWQTSNVWQSNLRKLLRDYNISVNEYLILETIFNLDKINKNISQIAISKNTSIVTSVVSSKLTFLEDKKFIKRLYSGNNRSNKITLTKNGYDLVENLIQNVERVEKQFFEKLNQETFNFTNSLKLLLGKKIRI
jgi:Transcriptional regulators